MIQFVICSTLHPCVYNIIWTTFVGTFADDIDWIQRHRFIARHIARQTASQPANQPNQLSSRSQSQMEDRKVSLTIVRIKCVQIEFIGTENIIQPYHSLYNIILWKYYSGFRVWFHPTDFWYGLICVLSNPIELADEPCVCLFGISEQNAQHFGYAN